MVGSTFRITALSLALIALAMGSGEPMIGSTLSGGTTHAAARLIDHVVPVHSVPQERTLEVRSVARLQQRIVRRFGMRPSIDDLVRSMTEQRKILSGQATLTFRNLHGETTATVPVRVAEHSQWLSINVTPSGPETRLSAKLLASDVPTLFPDGIAAPQPSTITAVTPEKYTTRVATDTAAKSGYTVDPQQMMETLRATLEGSNETQEIVVQETPGEILNQTGTDLGPLQLLASGRSNFGGSGDGRKFNVRKGLADHLHNTLVAPGETFSFNKVIADVPVREWRMALGIFNGRDLRPVPGGGICQVATTVFRAAINAGLPIVRRASHSLFVHYYEKYGVGIDATVFPGHQDLTFRNDTASYLLVQAYTEGDEATVNVYGAPDERTVELRGPYFAVNAPAGFRVNGRPLRGNEIAWERTVRYADGREETYTVLSAYLSIPRSVVHEYGEKEELLVTFADEE